MTSAVPEITFTQAFIGGEFVDAADGAVFDTYAPGNGERLAQVSSCSDAEVDEAVRAARAAFESGVWRDLPPGERRAVLLRFADLVEENLEGLARLEALDAGKTITDCREVDFPETAATLRYYAEAIDKVFGKITPNQSASLGLIVREPLGVVAAVVPWNFPALMMAWKMAPALAAGNSVIVKPAELSPLSALWLAELGRQAGLPAGVLNVVPGLGETAGRALGLHPDVDAVSFTGSTEVGRLFLTYAAQSNLKRIVLECGGKSPQVVMPDMAGELQTVAEDLAVAAFTCAGQNCTAGSRVLVHSSLHDELVDELVAAARSWTVGQPLDPKTKLGPLIEADAKKRVLGYVDGALEQGARVRCGGRQTDDAEDLFVPATVIDKVTPDMTIAREEVFGPVVCVLPFDTEAEALQLANDTSYGLAATVWSRRLDTAVRLARGIRAGTVAVNGYSEGDLSTPFGGYRQSGFGGRDKGLEAFDQYTELKTIWVTL